MLTRDVPTRKFLPTLDRYEPLVYDHTSTNAAKTCKRYYFYRYVLGRASKPDQDKDIIFGWGNAVHKFVEMKLKGYSFDESLEAAFILYKIPVPGSKWEHLTLKRFGDTMVMMRDFYDKEIKDGKKFSCVEQPFNFDFPDSSQGGGRWDHLNEFVGQDWVRDLKTTTQQASWFSENFNPNDQATRYIYARSRAKGWRSDKPDRNLLCTGIEFVVIENQKPPKTDKGTAKPPKVEVFRIMKTSDDLIIWEKEQMHIHKELELNRIMDVWPMQESQCYGCNYKKVCRATTDSSREYILRTEYVLKPWDHNKVGQTEIDTK